MGQPVPLWVRAAADGVHADHGPAPRLQKGGELPLGGLQIVHEKGGVQAHLRPAAADQVVVAVGDADDDDGQAQGQDGGRLSGKRQTAAVF